MKIPANTTTDDLLEWLESLDFEDLVLILQVIDSNYCMSCYDERERDTGKCFTCGAPI